MDGVNTADDRQDSTHSAWTPLISEEPHSCFWPHLSLSSNYNPRYSTMSDEVEVRVNRKATRRRGLVVVSGLFFVLLLVAAIVLLVLLLFIVGQQPPRVLTSCGTVEGVFNTVDKVFSFRGIPFAAPPIGERRWKSPEALTPRSKNGTCWSGILQAKKDPVECAQKSPREDHFTGSEDCLFLNVFTPTLDVRNPRPVMVWIHGGYLQWGNATIPSYSPTDKLTKKLNVVHVSIQYRLSAFGFLVLDALQGNGNYGILDQIEALRWIKENIANFGGDPEKVTIWGQSSGGTAAWALMMTPQAKGLFHGVWSLSGSPIFNKTIQQAKKENAFALLQPNSTITQKCEDITEDCLRSLSTEDVASMVYPFWDILKDSMDLPTFGYFEPALLVVDGHLFPQSPFDAWAMKTGEYSDVPIMFGSTAQEMDLNPAPGEEIKQWKRDTLEDYVATKLDEFGDDLTNETLTLYPAHESAEYTFTTMTSDLRVGCMNDVLVGHASEALSSPVYRYVATSQPSVPITPLGTGFSAKYSFHAWDALAFFDDLGSTFPKGTSRSDEDFRDILQSEMTEFVERGVPRSRSWLPYPNSTALIANTVTYVDRFNSEQCEMWQRHGILSYAWIN